VVKKGSIEKTAAKKAASQTVAIQDRRKLVKLYLRQHLTTHEIAVKLDVKTSTIETDIKAIDNEALGVHKADLIGRKQRELAELDEMEALFIKLIDKNIKHLELCLKDPNSQAKEIKALSDNVTEWIDKRLQVKRDRAKWLGFEKTETESADVGYQDNRSVVTIYINGKEEDWPKWVDRTVHQRENVVVKELNSG